MFKRAQESDLLRPWQLNIQILRDSTLSMHAQIEKAIIQDIKSGRLIAGTALPGSRLLASNIQVNRKTVIQAYDDLVAQGWLETQNKRGTFVAHRHQVNIKPQLSSNHYMLHRSEIAAIESVYPQKNDDIIAFSQGQPDPRLIPFEMLARVHRHALISASRESTIATNDPLGLLVLRQAVLTMLNIERGLHAKLNQICITKSLQMSLYLTAKTLIKTGDYIIFEQLTHPNVRETFKSVGASLLYVNQDEEGINTDEIEQLCLAKQALQRSIKAVYVTPNQQIPTTVTLSISRRKKLIELAERFGFTIIEDDAGFLHQFGDVITPPIASLVHHANVIYIASLTEALSNSVGVSFIVGEQTFMMKYAKQLILIDQQAHYVTELALSKILHSGQLKKHLMHTNKIYKARRIHFLKLIQQELEFFVDINPAKSGLAFWLKISSEIRMDQLLHDLARLKVNIQSGKFYAHNEQAVRGLLIGFANLTEDEAKAGIQRIKQAFLMQQTKQLSA